jgi:hypothetical protein
MAYRDDSERLRIRVDELESELAAAEATIAKLEDSAPRASGLSDRIHGGPFLTDIERTMSGALDDEALGEVAEIIERAYGGAGNISHVGKRFTWAQSASQTHSRTVDFSVMERDGKIQLRGRDDSKSDPIGIMWVVAFVTAIVSLVGGLIAAKQGLSTTPFALVGTLLTIASAAVMRAYNQRTSVKRSRKLTATLDDIEVALRPRPQRIAVDDGAAQKAAVQEAAELEAFESEPPDVERV